MLDNSKNITPFLQCLFMLVIVITCRQCDSVVHIRIILNIRNNGVTEQ